MAEKLNLEDAQKGDVIGPYRYTVTREMTQFAASTDLLSDPRYSAESQIAPSTLTDNDYSLAYMEKFHPGEAIHTKADNHYLNPPVIGKELIVTGTIADKFNKRGRDFIVFETTTRDEDGREIVRSKNTVLISMG